MHAHTVHRRRLAYYIYGDEWCMVGEIMVKERRKSKYVSSES